MRILLVDNEPHEASLMARVLERMGHATTVALHPNDALALVRGKVDAVVTSVGMRGMDGSRFARQVALRAPGVPVGFVAKAHVATSVVVAASQVGPVLRELWTVTDLKALVATLSAARRTAVDTSSRDDLVEDTGGVPLMITSAVGSEPTVSPPARRVRLSFRRWSQVEVLCDRWSDGPVTMAMRVGDLHTGEAVVVALILPDRTSMNIQAKVLESDGVSAVVLLSRLTPERVACLHTRCHHLSEVTAKPLLDAPRSSEHHPEGECDELKVSEIIMGNSKLRTQIDNLARKLAK